MRRPFMLGRRGIRGKSKRYRKAEGAVIPMRALQGAAFRLSKRLISGDVTVYLPQKSTVYRQVYRHVVADFGDSDETIVDGRSAKNRITSMPYSHPET